MLYIIKPKITGIKRKKEKTPHPGVQGPLGDILFKNIIAAIANP